MRKVLPLLLCLSFIAIKSSAQNVGIGTTTPQASAILDVSSNNKGFLPPRMTTAERNAIANKVAGLLIYNTNSACVEMYNGNGWISLCSSLPSSLLPKTLLGGNQDDRANYIIQTLDSGYVIAGLTQSDNGDVTDPTKGNIDCWIVKLSKTGNIEWNRVLGGDENDEIAQIKQTNDGGYIFCAVTSSSATGDVTGTNNGMQDYWVVKLDAAGAVTWDVILGGDQNEFATSIVQTADNGYAVGGYSESSANGNVTGTNHGQQDFWVVKLTSTGTVQWNSLIGGTGEDQLYDLQVTNNGLIASGYTTSGSGDVTGTVSGVFDFWVVRLNNTGGIIWNRLIGGDEEEFAYSVQQTADAGFIVAGTSNSSASGNISVSTHGEFDYLIMKLTSTGTTSWTKMLGGVNDERLSEIKQTTDGGYIVAGTTVSSATGNVSGNSNGLEDAWILKLDTNGNIVWEKLFGGSQSDFATSVKETFDGGYIVGGYTNSSASGSVIGTNHDGAGNTNDFWVLKLDANGTIQ